MAYTLHLFGLKASQFAAECRTDPATILDKTRSRVVSERRLSQAEIERGMSLAERIISGQCPTECEPDYFWALCWIADTVLERIPLRDFVSVKHFDYLQGSGALTALKKSAPPFHVPHSSDTSTTVGFIPAANLQSTIQELDALQVPSDEEIRVARIHFVEILESLEVDQVDLLAILTG